MSEKGNYDSYICEYLAANKQYDALKAMLKANPSLLEESSSSLPVLLRLRCFQTREQLKNIQEMRRLDDVTPQDMLSYFKDCAVPLDSVTSTHPAVKSRNFPMLAALTAFEIFYCELYSKYHGDEDMGRMVSGVTQIIHRCFRSQSLLSSIPSDFEEALSISQLQKDKQSFERLLHVSKENGLERFIREADGYLTDVEKGLGPSLITQILDDIVSGKPVSSVLPQTQSQRETRSQRGGSSGGSVSSRRNKKGKNWFTAEEIENLKQGVRRFGVGKWKEILEAFSFNERTSVDLKDKWRNLMKKARAEAARSEEAGRKRPEPSKPESSATSTVVGSLSSSSSTPAPATTAAKDSVIEPPTKRKKHVPLTVGDLAMVLSSNKASSAPDKATKQKDNKKKKHRKHRKRISAATVDSSTEDERDPGDHSKEREFDSDRDEDIFASQV